MCSSVGNGIDIGSGIEESSNFALADFLEWCVNSAHIFGDRVVGGHSSVFLSV